MPKTMQYDIKSIPHKSQRYNTCGDWWENRGMKHIRVSKLGDWRMEFCIAVHEMIEMALCEIRDIKEEDVTAFDEKYEKEREEGKHSPDDEPGDDPRAPYKKEHFFATNIERMIAHEFGIDWEQYADKVEAL